MVQKRPFVEELYEFSSKHPRQMDHNGPLVSFLEFLSEDVALKSHYTAGEGEGLVMKTIIDQKFGSGNILENQICTEKDIKNNFPDRISNSSWATSTTSEEHARLEAPVHILLSPEHCNSDPPRRMPVHSEDMYSSLLKHPPRKVVPVGADFQADIPKCCTLGVKKTQVLSLRAAESHFGDCTNDVNKLAGTCVIPMPGVEPSACIGDNAGNGTSCCCEDSGSIRCVRQHIKEARENLSRSLGQESFVELGFGDMGEVVAEKWSEEDEQLFHEVVCSNPASLRKNFWDDLSVVFPFRTREEIVGYYFNVYMLRIRAEQNRYDPMNIDSDNDEWQGSDDEVGMSEEEDDDSVVVSDDHGHKDDSHEYDQGIAHAFSDYSYYYEDLDFGCFRGIPNVSETCPKKLLNSSSSEPSEKIAWNGRGHDFRDGLCTSSITGIVTHVSKGEVDSSKNWTGTFSGTSTGHEFALEPCDAKLWDAGFSTCKRDEVDLLPTCSMIEEVFGVGAWNYKGQR